MTIMEMMLDWALDESSRRAPRLHESCGSTYRTS